MHVVRVLGASVIVASLGLAAGCAPSIRSERDANIPVPQGATWAWAATGAATYGDTTVRGRYIPNRYTYATADPIVRQRFLRAIDGAMEAKGFHRVGDTAQADFILSLSLDDQPAYAHGGTATAVGVGYYGGWGGWGWGYRPFGFYRPWGLYRPWGFYQPWGWGWSPWGWGFGLAAFPAYGYYAEPAYGYGGRGYRDGWLVVQLRLRSDGQVAWIGRYRTDTREVRGMSDAKLQEVVTKLFATLH